MGYLNTLRNEWIHFTPKNWSIEVAYVANTSRSTVEVLTFLLTASCAFFWHEPTLAERAAFLLHSLTTRLQEVESKI